MMIASAPAAKIVFFVFVYFFWGLVIAAHLLLIAYFITVLYGSLHGAPFLPANRTAFTKMLEFADIKPGQTVYDLGCGDGRLVFAAARKGANAVGIEVTPLVYALAMLRKKARHEPGRIILGNLFEADLRDADAVFCYLTPKAMMKLGPKFKNELKKGCRIICHDCELPGWKSEKEFRYSILVRKVPIYRYAVT